MRLWVIPPWVNRYSDGIVSLMDEKKMSASIITAPRIANGRRGVKPVAENRIQAIKAWESASTQQRFAPRQKKAVGSLQLPGTKRHTLIVTSQKRLCDRGMV
jgi:streptogramin lyase